MSENNSIPSPKKREDLHEITDSVFSLKSAIRTKLELEAQMEHTIKLSASLAKPDLWISLFALFSRTHFEKKIRRKIQQSQSNMDVEVKTKQRNIYHRNEMDLEGTFADLYKAMDENFDKYFSGLVFIKNNKSSEDNIPYQDVCKMVDKYNADPPKEKCDKLSLFLAMEKTLYSVNHPEDYDKEEE